MDCLNRLVTAGDDDIDYAVSDSANSGSQVFAGVSMSSDSALPGTSSDFVRKKGYFLNNKL